MLLTGMWLKYNTTVAVITSPHFYPEGAYLYKYNLFWITHWIFQITTTLLILILSIHVKRMVHTPVLRKNTTFREVIKGDLKRFMRQCCAGKKGQLNLASTGHFFFIFGGFWSAGNKYLYMMHAVLISSGASIAGYPLDPFSLHNK